MGTLAFLGTTAIIIIVAVVILLLVPTGVIAWLIGVYNGFVKKRVECENAWSQIDVQLKRRYDLIPNLVNTVKGYASHEKDTLEAVIKARQQCIDASSVQDQAAAENMLTSTLRSIFALSEAYPDLKANQNFMSLQEELTTTENKITFSRQFYNDTVQRFNTDLQVFPGNIVAGFFNFEKREFFELESEEEKQVPEVSF